MKYDEFWICLILLLIIALKGFGWPLCGRIDRSFFDVPIVPGVQSFLSGESRSLREWIESPPRRLGKAVSRHKSFDPSMFAPSHRTPVREGSERG